MDSETVDDRSRRLLRTIGHEMQQPVYAIQNLTLAALQYLKLGQSDRAAEMLAKVERQIVRSRELGERLHQFAGQPLGQLRQPKAEPVVIDGLIEHCEQVMRIFAGDAQADLRLDLRAGDAAVRCDRAKMQQVLLNLVRNATDSLALLDQPIGTLTIRTGCDGGIVSVRVIDNGPGLAPGAQERIFDLWFSTKDLGLGIGLAYSRQVVGSCGGTLGLADNRPGNVVFELRLPVVTRPDAPDT
jgi:C4-dicarboxylate-specific signal transduction histidine kinase